LEEFDKQPCCPFHDLSTVPYTHRGGLTRAGMYVHDIASKLHYQCIY